jgi:ATP-binding cassette, subfamily B, bacterial PglK
MIHTLRQLYKILDPATRVHFYLLLIPMFVMTALEILSIGLVVPVIQVLVLGQQDGVYTKLILDALPMSAGENPAPWVTGLFATFFILKNLLLLLLIYIVNRVVTYKTAIYARDIFNIYMLRPMEFHFHNNSAKLLLNITTGVNRSLETGRLVLMMTLDAMMMIGAFSLLIFAEPIATFSAALILLIVGLVFYFVTSPIFRFWGEVSLDLERNLIKWINQTFNGIRDVKLMQAEKYLWRKIESNSLNRARYLCLSTTSIHIPRLLIETVVVIGFLVIVLILLSAEKNPNDIVAVLGLFGMAALRLMPSLNRILTSAAELRRSAAYIDQVFEAFAAKGSESSGQDILLPITPVRLANRIEIKNLSYTYPSAESYALHDINLTVQKGQSIGFVGPSGAGKSTLMDIVLGLLQPSAGSLRIDGHQVAENISGWQANIGFVPQQVFLIDDTLRRNIAFGVEDNDVNGEALANAVRLANLEDFIATLPNGLSAVVGERGTRLSGGQRQRIAIARALYFDPEILVFDEATSALDNITEQEIHTAIETLAGDKTILIVAHRLSTVRKCDQLVFMAGGSIADIGTYDELHASNADFKQFAGITEHEAGLEVS